MAYLILPYIFFCFFLFTVGVGLFLSCISVFLRDVFYIYGIVVTIWNYLTPVFYSTEILPTKLQFLMQFNPLYQFLSSVRSVLVYGKCPSLTTLIVLPVISIAMFIFCGLVFKKNQYK